MGEAPNQPPKPEGLCKFSLFLFTLILCVILGAVLVVVPILTFEEKDTMKNEEFDSDLQFVFRQSEKFDTVVFKTSQPNGTGLYVFKKGYEKKLKATGNFTHQVKTFDKKLGSGESASAKIYYMPKSFLEIEGVGEEGTSLTYERMDPKKYEEFKEKNHVIAMSPDAIGSNDFYENFTYDTYGVHYIVITNKGKPGNVAFSANVDTPLYSLALNDSVSWCTDEDKCEFQSLPRDYFALVNVHVSEKSKMNTITITQIYNSTFRWTFPILIYSLLAVIIICDIIIYCVCASVAKKRGTSGYSSISDPINS